MDSSSISSFSSTSVKSSKISSSVKMSSFSSSMESEDIGVGGLSLGAGVDDLLKSAGFSDDLEKKMSLKSSGLAEELERKMSLSSGLSKGLSMESDLSSLIGSDAKSSSVSQVSQSSKKMSSSSVSASSMIRTRSGDGEEVVAQETIAEKSVKASESESLKRVEDGQVVEDSKQSSQSSARAGMRSTEVMSPEQLDAFFNQPALQLSLQSKPAENMSLNQATNTFEAKLQDLPDFSPDELVVKIIDNVITVVGNHEEETEGGNYKTQHYIRKFTVPKGLKTENIAWNLESNGILAITAGESVKGGTSQYHLDCTLFRPKSFFKK